MEKETLVEQTDLAEVTIRKLPNISYATSQTQKQVAQLEVQIFSILEPIDVINSYKPIYLDRIDAMISKSEFQLADKWYARSPKVENTQDNARIYKTSKKGIIGIDSYDEEQYTGYRFHYYVSEDDFPTIAKYLNTAYQNNTSNFSHTEIVDLTKHCVTHQLRNCKYRHDIVIHATNDSFSYVPIKYNAPVEITPEVEVQKPGNHTEDPEESVELDLQEDYEISEFINTCATLLRINQYAISINGKEIYKSDANFKVLKTLTLGPLEIKYEGAESHAGANFLLALLYLRLTYPTDINRMEVLSNNRGYHRKFSQFLQSKAAPLIENDKVKNPSAFVINGKSIILKDVSNNNSFSHGSINWHINVPTENYIAATQTLQNIPHIQVVENNLLGFAIKDADPRWYSYYIHLTKQEI